MSGAPGPGPGPGRSPLPCAPRPAAVLQLGGGAEPARPGVAVIDLRFPRGAAADVQEIVFRNFYTAFLSVRVQRPGPAGSRRWVTCLRDYCLMPCPHTEEGSQDYFSLHRHQVGGARQWPWHHPHPLGLTSGRLLVSGALMPHCAPMAAVVRSPRCLPCQSFSAARVPVPARAPLSPESHHEMLCDVDQVTAVRFILRQPSPVWLHFTIEELQIFPPGQKSPQKDFPSWLSQLTPPEQPASLHGELPDPEKVSTEVQQMWVLTEVIRARQAAARIGRFDVDGCYDINLLSYT